MDIWGRNILGREKSKCKDPVVPEDWYLPGTGRKSVWLEQSQPKEGEREMRSEIG